MTDWDQVGMNSEEQAGETPAPLGQTGAEKPNSDQPENYYG